MRRIKSREDQKLAQDILATEYFEASNVSWMLPKPTKSKIKSVFAVLLHDVQRKNGAFLTESGKGVLFLYNQNDRKIPSFNFIRKVYVICFVTGFKRGIKAIKWQYTVNSIRPKEGWLGIAFAIRNDENKMKAVFEIKREIVAKSRKSNLPIYAETTVKRIKELYESIGFEVYHEMKHDYAELTVWFLKRPCDLTK